MSFSVSIMLLSANEELDNAMISLLLTLSRPFQPRFHVFESRPLRAAAIYEYGVLSTHASETLVSHTQICIKFVKLSTKNSKVLSSTKAYDD